MTHEEIESAIERIEKLCEEKSYLAYDVMRALIGMDFPDLYDNIGTLIDLLRQADPDTHMELPVDADGKVIHIWDELCGYGYPNGVVRCYAIVNERTILVQGDPSAYKDWLLWDAANCRHHHKPTVEDVLRQFADVGIRIGAKHGIKAGEFTFTADEDAVAEYAAKLREVMTDDDAR